MSVLGLVHPEGDIGLVQATAAAGTIAVVSQSSLTSLEEIAGWQAAGSGHSTTRLSIVLSTRKS